MPNDSCCFAKPCVSKSVWTSTAVTVLLASVRAYADNFAKNWTGKSLVRRRSIGQAHSGTRLAVSVRIRNSWPIGWITLNKLFSFPSGQRRDTNQFNKAIRAISTPGKAKLAYAQRLAFAEKRS